jgi:hypothetical protein
MRHACHTWMVSDDDSDLVGDVTWALSTSRTSRMFFFHGTLTETVYCNQSIRFVDSTHPCMVCKLNHSLYASSRHHGPGTVALPPTWSHLALLRRSWTRPCFFSARWRHHLPPALRRRHHAHSVQSRPSLVHDHLPAARVCDKGPGLLHHFLRVAMERCP